MSYLDILKRCLIQDEGYRREPYLDTEGHWTIGIGHNCDASPLPKEWTPPLNDDQIDELWKIDIFVADHAARDIFPDLDDMTDNRKAAIVNLIFNMGKKTFSKFFTTIAAIRNGNWQAAGAGLRNSKWFKQVQKSRSERIIKQIVEG